MYLLQTAYISPPTTTSTASRSRAPNRTGELHEPYSARSSTESYGRALRALVCGNSSICML